LNEGLGVEEFVAQIGLERRVALARRRGPENFQDRCRCHSGAVATDQRHRRNRGYRARKIAAVDMSNQVDDVTTDAANTTVPKLLFDIDCEAPRRRVGRTVSGLRWG
jgi:hypothetical protein